MKDAIKNVKYAVIRLARGSVTVSAICLIIAVFLAICWGITYGGYLLFGLAGALAPMGLAIFILLAWISGED